MPSATSGDLAFWDTSAFALLCVHQRSSAAARRVHARRPRIIVWWGTPIEAKSAVMRLARRGDLTQVESAAAVARLTTLHEASAEVLPSEEVRAQASRLLDVHDLTAADALQLGAALVWCRQLPRGRWFVCFDDRLSRAARKEGFTILP